MRKKKILPFTTSWIDLKGIMLSEMSEKGNKSNRERRIPHDLTSTQNLKKKKQKQKSQTQGNRDRIVVARD